MEGRQAPSTAPSHFTSPSHVSRIPFPGYHSYLLQYAGHGPAGLMLPHEMFRGGGHLVLWEPGEGPDQLSLRLTHRLSAHCLYLRVRQAGGFHHVFLDVHLPVDAEDCCGVV